MYLLQFETDDIITDFDPDEESTLIDELIARNDNEFTDENIKELMDVISPIVLKYQQTHPTQQ